MCQENVVLFDGRRGHEVLPFEGERYSLVYFTQGDYASMNNKESTLLEEMGFAVPAKEDLTRLFKMTPSPKEVKTVPQRSCHGRAVMTTLII